MNNAPFKVGETVIAIKSIPPVLVKGQTYVVKNCFVFCECGTWVVNVGFPNTVGLEMCYKCNHSVETDIWFPAAALFASIEENTYEDVTKELAKLPVEETPDVKHIKELVN